VWQKRYIPFYVFLKIIIVNLICIGKTIIIKPDGDILFLYFIEVFPMKQYSLSITVTFLLLLLAITLSACSGSKSPVEPLIQDSTTLSLPDSSVNPPENRGVIAVYDATIDPEAGTFTLAPAVRKGAYHFALTKLYPDVLTMTGYGFTPNFWVDLKLSHPFPGSGIKGYDPRVIAIIPANAGVRFLYPTLGVGGNNSAVMEPDGYTKLFDELGGSIPGNVNPFKAYFKDQPNRVWSGTGVTQRTQRWNIDLDGFGGPLTYKLVVDVSTNYPNAPQPITDNAKEPVQINATIGSGLTTEGGSTEIGVTLIDWHGRYGVGGVKAEAPDLFDGTIDCEFFMEIDDYESNYVGTLSNPKLAPAGEYEILVAAWDITASLYMYKEFTVTVSQAPATGNLIWAKSAGGSSNDGGLATTTLSDNSLITTGRIQGSVVFGMGEINQTALASAGRLDAFVARYNPDGTLVWAKHAGGSSDDEAFAVTALSDNSVVVSGYFSDTATFGPGELNETVLTSAGTLDLYIARYNPDGTLAWAKRAGGTGNDGGRAIISLSDNSTVVTGAFNLTSTFGPGEPNETTLTAFGNVDIFIARYNPNGLLLWAKCAGGSSNEESYAITALSDNSTVVTGYFSSHDITFGYEEPNERRMDTIGNLDIFIARYNSNGTLAWATQAGGITGEWGKGITALSDNSTILTGYFTGTIYFGPGEPNETIIMSAGNSDIFIARYNSDGTINWARRAGGSSTDEGSAVATLSDDSSVVTGYFRESATFGPVEENETILTTAGGTDIFVARYNPDGSLYWVKQAGGTSGDLSFGISALADDSTAVSGNYLSSPVFGPGEANETILSAIGSYDIFVARFKP
jgi:uncharacterized delta-60 repeat protein